MYNNEIDLLAIIIKILFWPSVRVALRALDTDLLLLVLIKALLQHSEHLITGTLYLTVDLISG